MSLIDIGKFEVTVSRYNIFKLTSMISITSTFTRKAKDFQIYRTL